MTPFIQSRLADCFGSVSAFIAAVELHQRRWSFLIEYRVTKHNGECIDLLVKVPRLPEMTTLAQAVHANELVPLTQMRYEAMRKVWNAFADPGMTEFCAIRPLTFFPEWNAIVMEKLPLQPIKHLLLKPAMIAGRTKDWARFETALRHAGRWLYIFHTQVGNMRMERLNGSALDAEVSRTVAQLEAVIPQQVNVQDLASALRDLLKGADHYVVPVADLHGDFNCANIFTTAEGHLGALDIGIQMRGPVYIDLAMLISDLQTRLIQVVTHGLAFRQARLEESKATILAGYFDSQPFNQTLLDFYCQLTMIRKWTQDERRLSESTGLTLLMARLLTQSVRNYFVSELQHDLKLGCPVRLPTQYN